jgi:hypothetical protein
MLFPPRYNSYLPRLRDLTISQQYLWHLVKAISLVCCLTDVSFPSCAIYAQLPSGLPVVPT